MLPKAKPPDSAHPLLKGGAVDRLWTHEVYVSNDIGGPRKTERLPTDTGRFPNEVSRVALPSSFEEDMAWIQAQDQERPSEEPTMPNIPMCGRCYEFVDEVVPPSCGEKPESYSYQPLGMYHCPNCGAMVIAGLPHPYQCKRCATGTHPDYD